MLHSICMISIASIINDWWITLLFARNIFPFLHVWKVVYGFFSWYRFFYMNKFTSFHKIRIFASHFNTIFCDMKLSFARIWINVRQITHNPYIQITFAIFHIGNSFDWIWILRKCFFGPARIKKLCMSDSSKNVCWRQNVT